MNFLFNYENMKYNPTGDYKVLFVSRKTSIYMYLLIKMSLSLSYLYINNKMRFGSLA